MQRAKGSSSNRFMICPKFKMTKADHQEKIQDPTFGIQNVPKTCPRWVGRMGPYKGFLFSTKCHAWPKKETPNPFCKCPFLLHANSTFASCNSTFPSYNSIPLLNARFVSFLPSLLPKQRLPLHFFLL